MCRSVFADFWMRYTRRTLACSIAGWTLFSLLSFFFAKNRVRAGIRFFAADCRDAFRGCEKLLGIPSLKI